MATEKQIEANRRNAQKSTGPKTEKGKEIVARNAIKTGQYVTKFWRIDGELAGNLPICKTCGENQQNICRNKQTCVLQDQMTLAHLKTLRSKNLKHREHIDVVQIAQMDFIYSIKLKDVLHNLGETITQETPEGRTITRPAVSNEDMITLMNMANHLQKNLKAMQLTKESQDISDVAWADLATAKVDPEEAEKAKSAIMNAMEKWREKQSEANEMELLDEAIREHRMGEEKTEENENFSLDNINSNPFGGNGS